MCAVVVYFWSLRNRHLDEIDLSVFLLFWEGTLSCFVTNIHFLLVKGLARLACFRLYRSTLINPVALHHSRQQVAVNVSVFADFVKSDSAFFSDEVGDNVKKTLAQSD